MHYSRLTTADVETDYSITSRVVDRQFKFDDETKGKMLTLLRETAAFSGVEVLDFALMSNHFHIEVRVPPRNTFVPDKKVLERVGSLYGEKRKRKLEEERKALLEAGDEKGVRELLEPFRARMNDLSEFVKTFKQRVTMRYNNDHERTGTLWEGRFRSTLLERKPVLLRKAAAYMDLNPMRAGIVDEPGKYPWCGFGLACLKGERGEKAREGLALLYPGDAPDVFMAKHLELLLARFAKKGMNRRRRGEAGDPAGDYARRQSSMVYSRVIGSRAFVMSITGKRPPGGFIPLPDGLVAVGRERRRRA